MSEEKKVTIVCCYNDDVQYSRLKKSLLQQTLAYTLLGIDNREQRFSSCSSALNSVISQVQTEYVIYTHQDIALPEPDMLERFVAYLEQIGEQDILGVAGAAETKRVLKKEGNKADSRQERRRIGDKDGTCVLSCVRHGAALLSAGEVTYEGLAACDTVDECFFGGHADTFRKAPFDEVLCDNWHLYAVERCLHARMSGNHVWVCDLPLIHYSGGTINHAYNENFRRIAACYAKLSAQMKQRGRALEGAYIRTVCGSARINFWHRNLFYWKRELLFLLHRM